MSDATLLQTSKERDAAVIARQLAIFERDEFRALAKQLAEALKETLTPAGLCSASVCADHCGYGYVGGCASIHLWLSDERSVWADALEAARKAGLL